MIVSILMLTFSSCVNLWTYFMIACLKRLSIWLHINYTEILNSFFLFILYYSRVHQLPLSICYKFRICYFTTDY